MPFFGNIQEHSTSQLLGVQGSENLFHEFKVRQMMLNERGPGAKAMITKYVVSKKAECLNLVLNKPYLVPTYPYLFFSFPFPSCFLTGKP